MENSEIIQEIKNLLKDKSYHDACLILEAVKTDISYLAIILPRDFSL